MDDDKTQSSNISHQDSLRAVTLPLHTVSHSLLGYNTPQGVQPTDEGTAGRTSSFGATDTALALHQM